VRAQVYAAIKKLDKDGGAGAAMAALRIVQTLRHMQDSELEIELEIELERVRLAMGSSTGSPRAQRRAGLRWCWRKKACAKWSKWRTRRKGCG
jgi:hypothetical protein